VGLGTDNWVVLAIRPLNSSANCDKVALLPASEAEVGLMRMTL